MRRRLLFLFCFALVLSAGPAHAAKNVILLIADGVGSEQYTLARWVKGGPLSLDPIQVGAIRTFIADSVVADSAPAASAFATGVRTSDKFISVTPKRAGLLPGQPEPAIEYKPLPTVLEGARLLGKSTGIVVTSRVSHATPAAFVAHAASREQEEDIMEQAVHQDVNVVLGGGRNLIIPQRSGGGRNDGEDLREALRERGYQLPETSEGLHALKRGKVFGLFAPEHLEPEIDRPKTAPQQPTLEEMTRKALELLGADKNGFFLMVEASQTDWADHANDPAHLLSDLDQFDRAVQAALDFAKKDGETLVIACSDHNTGGLSIGNSSTSGTYSQMQTTALLAPLKNMRASAWSIWRKLGQDRTPEKIKALVRGDWGMEITDDEASRILSRAGQMRQDDQHGALGEVLCPGHTVLGWTTHGHIGGDVPLFAFGPGSPKGIIEAPQLAAVMAKALGLDMDRLEQRLFADASALFAGGQVALDQSDPANPVLSVTYKGRSARFPVNSDVAQVGAKTLRMEGLTVLSKNGGVYLPAQALSLVTGARPALPSIRAR